MQNIVGEEVHQDFDFDHVPVPNHSDGVSQSYADAGSLEAMCRDDEQEEEEYFNAHLSGIISAGLAEEDNECSNKANERPRKLEDPQMITLEELRHTVEMQHLIRNAHLEDDIKDPDILRQI